MITKERIEEGVDECSAQPIFASEADRTHLRIAFRYGVNFAIAELEPKLKIAIAVLVDLEEAMRSEGFRVTSTIIGAALAKIQGEAT